MASIDLETTKERARKLLHTRIASVNDFVIAIKRVDDQHERLIEAERADKKAYVRATKDGWSEDELKKRGLENAEATRRRTHRSGTTDSNSQ